jgi:hypothetical protein
VPRHAQQTQVQRARGAVEHALRRLLHRVTQTEGTAAVGLQEALHGVVEGAIPTDEHDAFDAVASGFAHQTPCVTGPFGFGDFGGDSGDCQGLDDGCTLTGGSAAAGSRVQDDTKVHGRNLTWSGASPSVFGAPDLVGQWACNCSGGATGT